MIVLYHLAMNPLLIGLLAVSQPVNKISKPATQNISQKCEKGKATEGKRKISYILCCGQKKLKTRNRIRKLFVQQKSHSCMHYKLH